jgi:anti-sigma B factor antagonist
MAVNRDTVPLESSTQLEIASHEQGTTMVIELAGELDLASATAVRQAMASAVTRRPERILLDLSQLAFIDSSGLHATIELAQRSAAQNVRLVIIPGPRAIQRVFEITGLIEELPFIRQTADGLENREIPQRPG